jgi:formate dehydrogenase
MEERLAARKSETAEFLLIGKRERHTHNTWMHNSPKLLGKETTNYAYLHPEDAVEKGIRDGDWVRIKGLDGAELRVPCRLSADLKRKVVALPHGWGHVYAAGWHHARERSGVNVNVLASDSVWRLESFAGMTWMNGIPVDVEPVRPAKRKKRKSGSGAPGDGG